MALNILPHKQTSVVLDLTKKENKFGDVISQVKNGIGSTSEETSGYASWFASMGRRARATARHCRRHMYPKPHRWPLASPPPRLRVARARTRSP